MRTVFRNRPGQPRRRLLRERFALGETGDPARNARSRRDIGRAGACEGGAGGLGRTEAVGKQNTALESARKALSELASLRNAADTVLYGGAEGGRENAAAEKTRPAASVPVARSEEASSARRATVAEAARARQAQNKDYEAAKAKSIGANKEAKQHQRRWGYQHVI